MNMPKNKFSQDHLVRGSNSKLLGFDDELSALLSMRVRKSDDFDTLRQIFIRDTAETQEISEGVLKEL